MDLDGLARGRDGGLGRDELRERGLGHVGAAGVGEPGGAVGREPGGLDRRPHVGDLDRDRLVRADRTAEGRSARVRRSTEASRHACASPTASAAIVIRASVRTSRHCGNPRPRTPRSASAGTRQPSKASPRVSLARQLIFRYGASTVRPTASAGTRNVESPDGPPPSSLAAVTTWTAVSGVPAFVMNAFAPSRRHPSPRSRGRRRCRRGVGPAARLGERERARSRRRWRCAGSHRSFCAVGPEPEDHRAPEPDRRRQRDPGRLVDAAELLERDAGHHRARVGAAVRLGEREPEQPELGHRADLVEREGVSLVAVARARRDAPRRRTAGRPSRNARCSSVRSKSIRASRAPRPSMSRIEPTRSVAPRDGRPGADVGRGCRRASARASPCPRRRSGTRANASGVGSGSPSTSTWTVVAETTVPSGPHRASGSSAAKQRSQKARAGR